MIGDALKNFFIAALMLLVISGEVAANEKERVLIIGDSISLGYTPFVEKALNDRAVIVHSIGNSQDSLNGVKNIDAWIGSEKWDMISFNFGLWDLCYRRPGPITQENRDKVNGSIAVPFDQYEQNLTRIAERLRKTGAKVIFQNTTVVPANEPGRYAGDVERYNRAAEAVMRRFDIKVNDLNAVSAKLPFEMRESDTDVHYTEPGYAELAKSVVQSIEPEL